MADTGWSNQRILVVDHELEFMSWADRALRTQQPEQVRSTMVGADTLKLLSTMNPTVILIDLELESMDAIDLIRKIRDSADSPHPDVPIVITTGAVDAERLRDACRVGIESIVRKPGPEESFIKRIRAAFHNPRRFIAAPNYFGPDRRRQQLPFEGKERRARVAGTRQARDEILVGGDEGATSRMSDEQIAAARARLGSGKGGEEESPEERARKEKEVLDSFDAHEEWVQSEGKTGRRVVLDRKELYGFNFSDANLRKASLAGAKLVDARCRRANFREADLQQADLSFSDCTQANFTFAKLRRANLSQAILDRANFNQANLSGANLSKSTLKNTNLKDAEMKETDLRGADIRTTRGLSEQQLNSAIVDRTTLLPPNLTYVASEDDKTPKGN